MIVRITEHGASMLTDINSQHRQDRMKTSGHLLNNGGIRGHSAGIVFPLVVVAKGTPHGILWYVQGVDGKRLGRYTCSAHTAHARALVLAQRGVYYGY